MDAWRTTYRSIVPDSYLAGLSYERNEQFWRRALSDPGEKTCCFLAVDADGSAVGFATGGPERSGDPLYRGELYAIYILQQHQRRGIGRRLTAAVVRRLRADGMDSMLVRVLAENPSRRFYEALGGVYLRQQEIVIGGKMLVEVAYGWQDTGGLAGESNADFA